MSGIIETKNSTYVLRDKHMKVLLMRQGDYETFPNYFTRFKSNVETLDLIG